MFCLTFEVPNANSSPFQNKQSLGNSYVRSTIKGHYEHSTQEKSIKQWRMIAAPTMQWRHLRPCPPLSHQSREGGAGGHAQRMPAKFVYRQLRHVANLHHLRASFEFSPELAPAQYHLYLHRTRRTERPLHPLLPSIRWMRSHHRIRLMMMLLLPRKHFRISLRGNQTTTPLRPETIQLAGKRRKIEC